MCSIIGCTRPVSRLGAYCYTHRNHARRHGHPEQQGVTAAALSQYRRLIKRRMSINADNRAWSLLAHRWEILVTTARASLRSYETGQPYVRYVRMAYLEIVRLADNVTADEIGETSMAMYAMREFEPRQFKDDRAFLFELVRRVRRLTRVNYGTTYNHATGKIHGVYRDPSARVTEHLGQLIGPLYGATGIRVADIEKADVSGQAKAHTELHEALEALR